MSLHGRCRERRSSAALGGRLRLGRSAGRCPNLEVYTLARPDTISCFTRVAGHVGRIGLCSVWRYLGSCSGTRSGTRLGLSRASL